MGDPRRAPRSPVARAALSEATRGIVRALPECLRTAYPVPEADAFRALTAGTAWPGDAIIWADVDAGRTRILSRAPRGIGR